MHLKFWKSFFNEQEPEIEEEEEDKQELAYFKIAIKSDMSLEMASWWDESSDHPELAYAYGTMLKFLTNGGYDILIATNLNEILEDADMDTIESINEILDTWKDGVDFKEMQAKLAVLPVISPLRTFNESNLGA